MPPIRARLSTPDPGLRPVSNLEPAVLVAALSQLERELTVPLELLRSNLVRKFSESSSSANLSALAETCRPETLVDLCDDLIRMTRVYFDESAVRQQALAPRPEIGLRLSTLIDEVDQRFEPEAARRDLAWECGLDGPDAPLATDPHWTRQAVGRAVSETLALACPGTRVTVSAHLDLEAATVRISLDNPSPALLSRLGAEEPEDCNLRFARTLLDRLGGGLEVCSETSSLLLLRLPV